MKSLIKLLIAVSVFLTSSVSTANESEAQNPPEKKSLFWVPATGLILPGFGQLLDGRPARATAYFGLTFAGAFIAKKGVENQEDFRKSDSVRYHYYRDNERIENIGGAISKHAAIIGIYDSFLFRVKDYQKDNKYLFLPPDQNLETIHKAPFQFQYLSRWTTLAPLALGLAFGISTYNESPSPSKFQIRPVDIGASSYESYVAGVTEEAMFRGWMQPLLYENTQSYWIANTIQAVAFGFVHGPKPYVQLAAGFYFGWLTPRNDWDLSESIFVHTWYDVLIITASYARSRGNTKDFNFELPVFTATF